MMMMMMLKMMLITTAVVVVVVYKCFIYLCLHLTLIYMDVKRIIPIGSFQQKQLNSKLLSLSSGKQIGLMIMLFVSAAAAVEAHHLQSIKSRSMLI